MQKKPKTGLNTNWADQQLWTPVGFILVSIYGDAHKTNQVLFELK